MSTEILSPADTGASLRLEPGGLTRELKPETLEALALGPSYRRPALDTTVAQPPYQPTTIGIVDQPAIEPQPSQPRAGHQPLPGGRHRAAPGRLAWLVEPLAAVAIRVRGEKR